jgi:hypothetical protein
MLRMFVSQESLITKTIRELKFTLQKKRAENAVEKLKNTFTFVKDATIETLD